MANNERSTKGKKTGLFAIGAGLVLAAIGGIRYAQSKKEEKEEDYEPNTEVETDDEVEVEDSEE